MTPDRHEDVARLVDELAALVPADLTGEQRRQWLREHLPPLLPSRMPSRLEVRGLD